MDKNSFFELTKTNVMVEFKIMGDIFDKETVNEKLSIIPNENWSRLVYLFLSKRATASKYEK